MLCNSIRDDTGLMMKPFFLFLFIFTSSVIHGEEFKTEEVFFYSHKDKLSGTIVFPQSGKISSSVVFVHGSGPQKRSLYWAQRFAAEGIAALVYDKRGVGNSGGEYEGNQSVSEKNINLLADDANAALAVLHAHSKTKELPIGLTGISQAGWIIPLAAEKSRIADFIILWSGPVCKVSEEDIYSKYTRDLDTKFAPSYEQALRERKQKYIWPDFLGKDSNPADSLVKLTIPGLWVFGENDGSVPVDLSIQRLKKLQHAGHKFDYILFSSLGHNNMPETFTSVIDWINRTVK